MSFDRSERVQDVTAQWARRPCQMCGASSWAADNTPSALLPYGDGDAVVGAGVIPVLPVYCKHCGNTVLVHSGPSGAIPNFSI